MYVWCGSFMRTLVAYFSIIFCCCCVISWVNASWLFGFIFLRRSALGLITTSFFFSSLSSFIAIIVGCCWFGVHFTTFQSRVSSMFVYHTITTHTHTQPHNTMYTYIYFVILYTNHGNPFDFYRRYSIWVWLFYISLAIPFPSMFFSLCFCIPCLLHFFYTGPLVGSAPFPSIHALAYVDV